MCTGIAVAVSEFPLAVATDPRLEPRAYERQGHREIQFHWWQSPTLLPVLWEGGFHLLPWGSKTRRGPLPTGGWIPRDRIEAGDLGHAGPEEVVIPANLGHHKGTWFLISEGIQGVLLRDRADKPLVYMVTEPASNYYRNMTEQEAMMPIFVGQVI
jgi:hypothetical protein